VRWPLSDERLRELIINDYGNNSVVFLAYWLSGVADGSIAREEFFETGLSGGFLTFDEYIEEKVKRHFGFITPEKRSPEAQAAIDRANNLALPIKDALTKRRPIKEIYKLMLVLAKEIGIDHIVIESLED
jgi:hypothetical protein